MTTTAAAAEECPIPNVVSVVDPDVEVLGTTGTQSSPRLESSTAELPSSVEIPPTTSDCIPSSPSQQDNTVEAKLAKRGSCTAPKNVSPPSQNRYSQHHEAGGGGSFSISYKAYLRAMSCAIVNMLPFPWRARQPRCVLLGRRYDFSDSDDHEAFKSDFTSRVLFTYRHGFTPLTSSPPRLDKQCDVTTSTSSPQTDHPNVATTSNGMNRKISSFFRQRRGGSRSERGLTSDSGWGCMIRVFQMAMAQTLMQLHFGRDWRRPQHENAITIDRKQVLLSRCASKHRRSFSFDSEWPVSQDSRIPSTEEILRLLNNRTCPAQVGLHPFRHNSNSMPLLMVKQTDETSAQNDKQATHLESCDQHQSAHIYPWNLLPILSLFRDVPAARFSLHRIVAVGRIGLGIKAGAWFGPTSCSDSMAALIRGSSDLTDLPGNTIVNQKPLTVYPDYTSDGIRVSVYHSKHGEISRKRVQRLFRHTTANSMDGLDVADLTIKRCYRNEDLPSFGKQSHRRLAQSSCERAASLPPSFDRMRRGAHHVSDLTLTSRRKTSDSSDSPVEDDLLELSSKRCTTSDAVIIFLSFRLGLDSFNMRYQPFLQSCFGMPQFQGLAGGGPLTSAYWFVAANDEHLYFLDPHSPVQPALRDIEQCVSICESVTHRDDVSALSSPEAPKRPSWLKQKQSPSTASEGYDNRRLIPHSASSEGWTIYPGLRINHEAYTKEAVDHMFFPSAPKQLNWRALNPSMTLVFLCQSFLAFEDLLLRLSEVDSEGLISVVEDEGYGISSDFGLQKSGGGRPESRNLSFDSAEDGFYLL